MSTDAIVMLIVSILVLWGGLGLALLNLVRGGPDSPDGPASPPHDADRDG